MTAPVFIRRAYERTARWHRLSIVGVEHHTTACLDGIPVSKPVLLTSDPPADELCPACRRDLQVRQSRVPTVDLRPRVRELGLADLASDPAIAVGGG